MTRIKRRKLQNSFNDDCLREMAEHIIYEIDGFRKGFDKWQQLSGQAGSSDSEAFNRVVEVALLHYRTLLEFFRSHPVEVDVDNRLFTDIVATDYVSVSISGNFKKQAEELCKSYKARIDQQLCHISTGRRESNIWREWPTGVMKAKMECLIRQFKESLHAERATWFSSLTDGPTKFLLGEVSNGTYTHEVKEFPMPFSAPSAFRR